MDGARLDLPGLDQGGMEIEVVRHDRRADNADGDIKRFFAAKAWDKAGGDVMDRRPGEQDLHEKGEAYNGDQSDDKSLHPAHTQSLQEQKQEGIQHGDTNAVYQGQAGEQLDADGHAQYFGEVAGCDRDLGEDIQRNIDIRGIYFPVGLSEVPAAEDAQAGPQVLKKDGDAVTHQQHPEQRVAEAAAACQIGGPVTRVH